MKMKALLISSLFLMSAAAMAQDMFIIQKSMNPKNVLHFKANVEACKLKSPAVTAYWVMGEEDGHTEGLTSQEKPYFQPKISYAKETESDFSLGAMEKMGSKIPDKSIRVRLENCKPKAFIELNGGEVQLTNINVSVNMFMSVKSMTISGIAQDGSKVSHKIDN
jgi:hypothetical protein